MKTSYNWLKSYVKDLPPSKELENLFTFHVCEVEEVIKKPGDVMFNLKILPDRAGDLLSHLGVAKELSGLLGLPFIDPTPYYKIPSTQKTNLKIDLQSQNCRRYMGRIIRNFKVGPSPEWVVKYLESIGERSINNIVDASNIVMYDCGQPTHAFDLKKLKTEKIIITDAKQDQDFPVVGSDPLTVKIKTDDLVICDDEKVVALAGIKGGTNSGISIDSPYTTDILIEVASFDPVRVRKTGQRLGLLSDARKRFENNVPAELGDYAMRELGSLILEMCPDCLFEDIVDVHKEKDEEKRIISFTTNIINEKLGATITPADIAKILQNYQYSYAEENGNFIVHIPYWRQDLKGIHDMTEEIGRVYGYDKILPQIPTFPMKNDDDTLYKKIILVKHYLARAGYSEVMTYTFCKKGEIQVARGPKGKEFLRTNLTDGLKESFEKNRLNAPLLGIIEVKIFEVGTVFVQGQESMHIGLATKKGVEEYTLDDFIAKNNILSEVDEQSINTKVGNNQKFIPWSEYPFIFRDVSFWAEKEITESEFVGMIKESLTELCVKGPYLIDTFSKEGRYSYAFRFVFQSYEKTLTEQDVESDWDKIIETIKEKGFKIR